MRPSALRLVTVVLAAVLALGACGDDDEPVAADGGAEPTGPALADAYVSVGVTEGGEPRPLVEGTQIQLRFDGSTVGASLGCNSMGGTYRLEDGVLVVEDGLSMTEMGCDPERHAQDEWFAGVLTSRPALAVDGDTLTITSGDTVVTLQDREVAEPDRELVGTRWEIDGFLEGAGPDGTAMSMAVDEPGTLELQADGLVVGSDGCNSFGYATGGGGQVTDGLRHEVDGDRITFTGAPVSELRACDELEEYVERAHAGLSGTVTWDIEADRLTLVAEDGRGVTYRALD